MKIANYLSLEIVPISLRWGITPFGRDPVWRKITQNMWKVWANAHFFFCAQKNAENSFRFFLGTKKVLINQDFSLALRTVRDSNPRCLAARWFSRPVHSTTLPTIRMGCKNRTVFCICKCFHKKYYIFFISTLVLSNVMAKYNSRL